MKIIKSGSTGNCFIYNEIMIDCGVSYKIIKKYLKNIRVLLITHRHSDHMNSSTIKTISKFHKNILIIANEDVALALKKHGININILNLNDEIDIKYDLINFNIKGVDLYHDVPNYGFFVTKYSFMEKETFFYATDTYTLENIKIPKCDRIFLECNYEEKRLIKYKKKIAQTGGYDYTKRVEYTHLSYKQWLKFQIEFLKKSGIAYAMHMSENTLLLSKNHFTYEELKIMKKMEE